MASPDDRPGPPAPDATRARAARLEARLAVYAQYAAVVAEQAEATLAGDGARADALAEARARAAEHFAELREPTPGVHPGAAGASPAGSASFRAALDDALAELAHQGAVDSAFGARLASLRDAVLRGAAWGAAGDGPTAGPDDRDLPQPDDVPLGAPLGGALVAARAAGVGGPHAGRFPGRLGPRALAAPAHGDAGGTTPGGPAAGPQVDIRF